MKKIEIVHELDAEGGYFGGETLTVDGNIIYVINGMNGKWHIFQGEKSLASFDMDTRPGPQLSSYLERLLNEYQEDGLTLESKSETREGDYLANRITTVYVLRQG